MGNPKQAVTRGTKSPKWSGLKSVTKIGGRLKGKPPTVIVKRVGRRPAEIPVETASIVTAMNAVHGLTQQ